MSLQTKLGYPVGTAAALVGGLRQIQRWLPRYEWTLAHQLPTYAAGINISALLIGTVGVFLVGIQADRSLDHQWELSAGVSMALVSALIGLGVGTALTFSLHPGFNTVTITPQIAFVGSMAVYVVTQGVPIGVAGVAGLAMSRIYAAESVKTHSDRSVSHSVGAGRMEANHDGDTDSEQLSVADTDSTGSSRLRGSSR